MNSHAAILPLVWALLALLLCGCGKGARGGAEWQAPPEESMPQPFAHAEGVPDYMRGWRMPEAFPADFAERWNAEVRQYIDRQLETGAGELAEALNACATPLPLGEDYAAAQTRALAAAQSVCALLQRRSEGDYLTYRTVNDIPRDMTWQNGADEPELGSPNATKGGTLRLAIQKSFPDTLRPIGPGSNAPTRLYLYDDITLPMVRIHPGTDRIIPGTADRWAVSEDGRTVYFHIDEAARFSNGRSLTARDILTALFVRTSPYSVESVSKGDYLHNISRITIYGDRLLSVTLAAARPYAPHFAAAAALAECTAFYAEFGPDYPARYQWRAAPTSGGYALDPAGVVMGHRLTMRRVQDWWAADRKYTRHSCNVDRITYSFINEPAKIQELFRVGEIDAFSARDADFWYEGLEIDAVRRGFIQRVRFSNIWPRNSFGFYLNASAAPFSNRDMRLGFHHALNIRHVIETILRGDFERAGSFFRGFGKYTDATIQALPYSPQLAREHFARAGFTVEGKDGILCKPDGTRLQVVVSSRIDPQYANCMNTLRQDAAACGLDLRLEQMDDTVFFQKVRERRYSAAIWSWSFQPPLPDAAPYFLSTNARHADGTPVTGTNNITGTADPALDRAIMAARNAGTEDEAAAAHHRLQRLIADTAVWVPAWTSSYWRFAQWRWLRWPDEPQCRFCPPRYYDPLESHLYWVDEDMKRETLRARHHGDSFPEQDIVIPLPEDTPNPPNPNPNPNPNPDSSPAAIMNP